MALIDVTDVVLDPDFLSPISLIHRTASVNTYGQNVPVEATPISTWASVQPASGKDLHRLPEAFRQSDIWTFYCKAPIISDGIGIYPDIIVYNGSRYQVQLVNSWLQWGQGWNQAICIRERLST